MAPFLPMKFQNQERKAESESEHFHLRRTRMVMFYFKVLDEISELSKSRITTPVRKIIFYVVYFLDVLVENMCSFEVI